MGTTNDLQSLWSYPRAVILLPILLKVNLHSSKTWSHSFQGLKQLCCCFMELIRNTYFVWYFSRVSLRGWSELKQDSLVVRPLSHRKIRRSRSCNVFNLVGKLLQQSKFEAQIDEKRLTVSRIKPALFCFIFLCKKTFTVNKRSFCLKSCKHCCMIKRQLNWPKWNVCHSSSASGQHSTVGPFKINKDNDPGIVRLVMRWLQAKENTSIKQEGLLCYMLVMQWHGSPKCLHMNASEPLIYYNPIVGEPCEHRDGWNSISVHASPKSSNYGGVHRVPVATLTSVSLGGLLLNGHRPSRQPHWGLAPVVPVSRASGYGLPHWCGGAVMRL